MIRLVFIVLALVLFPFQGWSTEEADTSQTSTDRDSDEFVISWTATSVAEIFHFGFNDIEKRKIASRKFFTEEGYNSFYEAMDRSKIPEMIINNLMVASATVTEVPIIAKKELKNGINTWVVHFPFIITYRLGARSKTDRLLVQAVIFESNDPVNNQRLAIQQWVAVPRDGPAEPARSSQACDPLP